MKIDFKEDEKSLTNRIKIHDLYGSANIDDWMLDSIKVKKDESILDLGCGDGKQSFAISNYLDKNFQDCNYKIIGMDEHEDLIEKANKKNSNQKIKFDVGSFDKNFPYPKNSFDLIIACFAIYYAENIDQTVNEIKRVLKKNGRIFFTGPMPNNKFEFNEIIEEASNAKVPKLIGSSRFSSEIFDSVKKNLDSAKIDIFKNELKFDKIDPYIEYARSALEKNRKVYEKFLEGKNLDLILTKVSSILQDKIKKDGKLVMTKMVGGIMAYKIND
tara:strand:+ start:986 stop:1801 length:816 start_codon:yes stop_codon:yes gene_type:complete